MWDSIGVRFSVMISVRVCPRFSESVKIGVTVILGLGLELWLGLWLCLGVGFLFGVSVV